MSIWSRIGSSLSKLLGGRKAANAVKAGSEALEITVKNAKFPTKLFAGSVAGTAVGTYLMTVYGKAGDVNSTLAEILGVPESVSAAVIAACAALAVLYVLTRIFGRRGR